MYLGRDTENMNGIDPYPSSAMRPRESEAAGVTPELSAERTQLIRIGTELKADLLRFFDSWPFDGDKPKRPASFDETRKRALHELTVRTRRWFNMLHRDVLPHTLESTRSLESMMGTILSSLELNNGFEGGKQAIDTAFQRAFSLIEAAPSARMDSVSDHPAALRPKHCIYYDGWIGPSELDDVCNTIKDVCRIRHRSRACR